MEKSSSPIPVDGSDDLFIITNRIGFLQIAKKESETYKSCEHMYSDLNEAKKNVKDGSMCKNCGSLKKYKKSISKRNAINFQIPNPDPSKKELLELVPSESYGREKVYLYKNGFVSRLSPEDEYNYLDRNDDMLFVRSAPSTALFFCKNGFQLTYEESLRKLNQYPMYANDELSIFPENQNISNLSEITHMDANHFTHGMLNLENQFKGEYYKLDLKELRHEIDEFFMSMLKTVLDEKMKEYFNEISFNLEEFEELRLIQFIAIDYENFTFKFRNLSNVMEIYLIRKFFDGTKKFNLMKKHIKSICDKFIQNDEVVSHGFRSKKELKSMLYYVFIYVLYNNNSIKSELSKFLHALEILGYPFGNKDYFSDDTSENLKKFIVDELQSFLKKKESFASRNKKIMQTHSQISNEFIYQQLMKESSNFYKDISQRFKDQMQNNPLDLVKRIDLSSNPRFIDAFFKKTLTLKQLYPGTFYENQEFLKTVNVINRHISDYAFHLSMQSHFFATNLKSKVYPVPEVVMNDNESPLENFLNRNSIDVFGKNKESKIMTLIYESSVNYDVNRILKKYEHKIDNVVEHMREMAEIMQKACKLLDTQQTTYTYYLNPSPIFQSHRYGHFIGNIFPIQFILDPSQNGFVYGSGRALGLVGSFMIKHIVVESRYKNSLLELLNFIEFQKEVYITTTEDFSRTQDRLAFGLYVDESGMIPNAERAKKMNSITKNTKIDILKKIRSTQN